MHIVYTKDIREISQADISFIQKKYSERYEKAISFRDHDDFLRCIAGYLLIDNNIGPFNESDVHYDNGKPYITNFPYFNIAHSKDFVVLAMSDNEVGIDIEYIEEKKIKSARAISKGEELRYINEDPINRFHLTWVKKESILKCTGEGITNLNDLRELVVYNIKDNETLKRNRYELTIESYIKDNYAYAISEIVNDNEL